MARPDYVVKLERPGRDGKTYATRVGVGWAPRKEGAPLAIKLDEGLGVSTPGECWLKLWPNDREPGGGGGGRSQSYQTADGGDAFRDDDIPF